MLLQRSQLLDHLPILLASAVGAALVWRYGQSADALGVVLGVIAGGLVDQDHRLVGRLQNVALTLLAFALSSLAVEWSVDRGFVFVAVMGLLTFGFTMLGAAGSRYRTVSFGALAVATYTSLTAHALPAGEQLWGQNSLLILGGTLLYSLMSLLVYAAAPYHAAQQQLALACAALGQFIDLKSRLFDDDAGAVEALQLALALQNRAVIARFNDCRRALAYRLGQRMPRQYTRWLTQLYFVLQDVHERVSSAHLDYQQFRADYQHTDLPFRLERLLAQQGRFCSDLAAQLPIKQLPVNKLPVQQRPSHSFLLDTTALQRAEQRARTAWAALQPPPHDRQDGATARLLDNLLAVNQQLLVAAGQPGERLPPKIAAGEDESLGAVLRALRQNWGLHSVTFRHALRLTLVVTLSAVIALVFRLPLGFWIMLTALFVCQPSYTATRSKVTQRVVGTLLGALVGSALPALIPSEEGRLLVMVLSTTLFFMFRSYHYSWSTFFITVEALCGLSLIGHNVSAALLARLLDTLLGSGLAWLAVSLLWPDWHWLDVRRSAAQALAAIAAYLRAILQQLRQGRADDLPYRLSRRRAHEQTAELGREVSEILAEAGHYGLQAQLGPRLLVLTYGLLGAVSALGAYRSAGQGALPAPLRASEPAAPLPPGADELLEQLLEYLLALPGLDAAASANQLERLNQATDALPPESLLAHQLPAVLRLLGEYHALLRA